VRRVVEIDIDDVVGDLGGRANEAFQKVLDGNPVGNLPHDIVAQ